jgi:spectinomycin phosphotransferase
MLEKPELADEDIIRCLHEQYGLSVGSITFLPLGADLNTAVYRATTRAGTAYFVKLRRGDFNEACVAVPNYLHSLGIRQIIPALCTQTGQPWAALAPFKVILYPFVEGQNGFDKKLSEQQWVEFGAALKRFHTADLPAVLTSGIPCEDFSPRWRELLKMFLGRIESENFKEPVAAELAAFLKTKKECMVQMVERAERFAGMLQEQPPAFILCHADIHIWNLFIDVKESLYMVDWDTLLFAPKERDLMFIGGGLGDSGTTPEQEERLFYHGYGPTDINQVAISYYRYERIVEDMAVYCEQLLLSEAGGEDRKQSLAIVKFYFLPGGTIARTYQCDKISNGISPESLFTNKELN